MALTIGPQDTETTPKSSIPPRKKSTTRNDRLRDDLSQMYSMFGIGVAGLGAGIGDNGIAGVGMAMLSTADDAADAWMELAERNPKVRERLEQLTSASALGGIIAVHFTMLTPLLVDRKVFPSAMAAGLGVDVKDPYEDE